MQDYKDTLNLPTTAFPMKANLPQRELEILERWKEINLYHELLQQFKNRKNEFILHDGPPYANGHLHIGHALNKTLKDIIVKSKILSGYAAPYVPGWDCHGLPIELNVEKKHGKAGEKLSPEDFRAACREYAAEQIGIQKEEFKRLGVVGDWDNPYITMDSVFEANIIRALAEIVKNGYVQRGYKPVHWCLDCRSALAEAEVEYANKSSPAIDVRFRVVDENEFWKKIGKTPHGQGPISIPIWTTTPWTLPANEAVALGAEHEYVLVQITTAQGPERLLLASQLLSNCLARYRVLEPEKNPQDYLLVKIEQDNLKALERLPLQHPFYDRQVPIVFGDHVTLDAGTGAVHTAPAHGLDDYYLGRHYQLPLINPVGDNGCFLPDTPLFAGVPVFKANALVIEELKKHGALLFEKPYEHSYPHCWRHKTPLIFRATPQWFVPLEGALRPNAVKAAEAVNWQPEWGRERMVGMVDTRPDWCISRQRSWGTPITFLVHKQSGALHPNMPEIMKRIAEQVAEKGMEVWFSSTPADWLNAVESADYEKITDVLDVWFDSGVTHFCVLRERKELQFPADMYLEGSDQYRGWFQSSLLTSVALTKEAPYKTVLTHGFTVDDKGHKMSKSLGNVVAPEKVINSLGADILRLWVAATDYRGEVAISPEILQRTAEAYRRLRNTARFLLANLHDFDPIQNQVKPEEMLSLDRWVVECTRSLQRQIVEDAYEKYQFHLIYQKLYNFCVVDLGGFYFDIIKDRQYTLPKNSRARRSAQTALCHIAEALVRWLAPILSFTAEEIWQSLPGKRSASVFFDTWYENLSVSNENDPFATQRQGDFEVLRQVRDAVNKEIEKCRATGTMGGSLEAEVELYCENNGEHDKNNLLQPLLEKLENELRFVLITSTAVVLPFSDKPADAQSYVISNDRFTPFRADQRTLAMIQKDGSELPLLSGGWQQTLWIMVTASQHPKCARCWHRREDVGSNAEHPDICQRCVTNLTQPDGEERHYA